MVPEVSGAAPSGLPRCGLSQAHASMARFAQGDQGRTAHWGPVSWLRPGSILGYALRSVLFSLARSWPLGAGPWVHRVDVSPSDISA